MGATEETSAVPSSRTSRSRASDESARRTMRGNRGRDTKPELALRSAVHRSGLRYRVCARPLPELRRTADLVFRRAKVAVYCDGCFWHGCPEHYRAPASNAHYWGPKIDRNRWRDKDTDARLAAAGWLAIRVWEHDDPQAAAQLIAGLVTQRACLRTPSV